MAEKSPWVKLERGTGDLIANPFPAVCCQCLKPTQSKYRMLQTRMRQRYGPAFYVPFCSACQKELDRKRNIVGAIVLSLLGVGLLVIWLLLSRTSDRIAASVALMVLSTFGTIIATSWRIEPFQAFNGRIRFRNPEFARLWLETWGKPIDFILPQPWQKRSRRDEQLP